MNKFLNSLLSRKLILTVAALATTALAKLPDSTRVRYSAAITIAYFIVNVIESTFGPGDGNPPAA